MNIYLRLCLPSFRRIEKYYLSIDPLLIHDESPELAYLGRRGKLQRTIANKEDWFNTKEEATAFAVEHGYNVIDETSRWGEE